MKTPDQERIPELGFKCAEYVYSYIEESERDDYLTNKKNLGELFQEYEGVLEQMVEDIEDIEFDFENEAHVKFFDDVISTAIRETVEMLEVGD